jgi:hypothetical protein
MRSDSYAHRGARQREVSCSTAQAAPVIRKSLRCIYNHLTNLSNEPMTSIRAKDITLLESLLGFSSLGVWYLSVSDSPFDKCLQEADKKNGRVRIV